MTELEIKAQKDALLAEIKTQVGSELNTRGYQKKEEVEAMVSKSVDQFKDLPLEGLRSIMDEKTGVMSILKAQGAEIEALKENGIGKPKDMSIRGQIIAWRDANKNALESIKGGTKAELTPLEVRVASPMTPANTLNGSAYLPKPEYQVAPNTSEAAKKLGGILGESPIIVDHIMKGYTGSLGMYAIDLIDAVLFSNDASPKPAKRFEQMPVIKRFIVDKEAKGTVTAYYDLKNSVDEVVRTVNLMERTGNVEGMGDYIEKNAYLLGMKGYISSVEKQMKVLREAAIQIRSSDMSPEEKRESLSAITQAQNAMTANIREIKKSIQQ